MIVKAENFKRSEIEDLQSIDEKVKVILNDIRDNGDVAINQWNQKIDGSPAQFIKLLPFNEYGLAPELSQAIVTAYSRIKSFCEFQMKGINNQSYADEYGEFGYVYEPIEKIGAYIPGGNFPLISSALMTLTPAQVAGCLNRTACSPSNHPALLAAASLAGATEFIHIGGAQAIGALSYGYENVDPVNMIVGPGNAYVNSAKAQVQDRTKIDTLAGPSELMIYANLLNNPEWIMYDALAQAEHDSNAISIIVSTSQQLLDNLYSCTKAHDSGVELIKNNQIQFVLADNQAQAIELINDYAPEHLMVVDSDMDMSAFKNYGSLFVGENSAVAFGDYCAGPNHTLPTNGAGKYSGGLSIHQFLKVLSSQKINEKGRVELAKTSAILAQAEGLLFHQKSAELRK